MMIKVMDTDWLRKLERFGNETWLQEIVLITRLLCGALLHGSALIALIIVVSIGKSHPDTTRSEKLHQRDASKIALW